MNNFERMQAPQAESLDANWYERFQSLGSFQAHEYFDGDKEHREEQQRAYRS